MSTVTDPIADLLARVRNAGAAQKPEMFVPYSKIKAEVIRILKEEGYIIDYSVDTEGAHPRIKITNKIANRTSTITGLKRVSRASSAGWASRFSRHRAAFSPAGKRRSKM
jgi:small subunit ribosomal protein S8